MTPAPAPISTPPSKATTEQIRKLHDLNIIGPTLVTQAPLPALRSSRGSIVNVASTVALKPTASKLALCSRTCPTHTMLGPRTRPRRHTSQSP
ncbi:SDR family NAD(P)-dependent oxidoreductase [Rhodococcus qingshengii]|uniref:SDR family NAD(P)-dependent oxidoreductase n=1 Tax=Rhodococcus qingshengii TaxID=334542 RepID=UPI0010A5DB86|nr:SDR family oxidoreductase [Rhodococcus qingshengii]